MPKLKRVDSFICATCGRVSAVTLPEHWKQFHQNICTIRFPGEHKRECKRHQDGRWQCPQCKKTFMGSPRGLQDHVRGGDCSGEKYEDEDGNTSVAESGMESGQKEYELEYKDSGLELGHDQDDEEEEVKQVINPASELDLVQKRGATRSVSPQQGLGHDQPSHPPVEYISISSGSSTPEPGSFPALIQPKEERISGSSKSLSFRWANLHQSGPPKSRVTLLGALQSTMQSSSNPRPKPESHLAKDSLLASLTLPAIASSTPSTARLECLPSPAGPSSERNTNPTMALPGSPIPPALKAFFGTIQVPVEHLAPIFIKNGFDTDNAIDLLYEHPPEGHWEAMKDEIIKQGRLAGWLAIQKGLRLRATQRSLRQSS